MNAERRKLYLRISLVLVVLILLFQFLIPSSPVLLNLYIDNIFVPLQRAKTYLLHRIPLSVGDIIYMIIIIGMITLLVRYLISWKKHKQFNYNDSLIRFLIVILLVIFSFSFTWNPIYQREKLNRQFTDWKAVEMDISEEMKLNQYLHEAFVKMGDITFPVQPFSYWNTSLIESYQHTFSEEVPFLSCKKSLFGQLIQSMGIQGYYNPLSGEAQINENIPNFLHPFVMAHEMAHQLGIASEADANFMAYYICSQSQNRYIQYSAIFNLYLYNIRNISRTHPDYAALSKTMLPPWVHHHLDILADFNNKKPLPINEITMPLYEWFLKINGESAGLKSYGGLTKYAFLYELGPNKKTQLTLRPYK